MKVLRRAVEIGRMGTVRRPAPPRPPWPVREPTSPRLRLPFNPAATFLPHRPLTRSPSSRLPLALLPAAPRYSPSPHPTASALLVSHVPTAPSRVAPHRNVFAPSPLRTSTVTPSPRPPADTGFAPLLVQHKRQCSSGVDHEAPLLFVVRATGRLSTHR
ncbi:hypothetical protein B0H12DRAFT_304946 [Mycena haematopus]|nr:hypothetical protein B0H12DRAFT_304946 [Mycena haematopus]